MAETEVGSFSFECGNNKISYTITVTEIDPGDGSGNYLRFDVEYDESSKWVADIRGFFFDLNNDDDIGLYTFSAGGADVTDYQFEKDSVVDLGNGANMNGSGFLFDAGVEIGEPGLKGGEDDYTDATFYAYSSELGGLHLTDIAEMYFGIRLTSYGPENNREFSLKLICDMPPVDPPQGGDAADLIVEEEELTNGIDDENVPNPQDEDSGGDLTLTQEADTESLSFTAGTYDLTSFVFADQASIDASLETSTDGVAGAELYWVRESDTQIVGYFVSDDSAAVTIDLVAPASITANTTGSVDVTLTVLQPLSHHVTGDDIETVLNLGTVEVIASDVMFQVSGTATLYEIDDVPELDELALDENAAVDEGDSDGDENGGTDPLGIGTPLGVDTAQIIETPVYAVGADYLGAPGLSVTLNLVNGDDSYSGLDTTIGTPIQLFNNGGVIEGREGGAGGDVIFAFSIDNSGLLTLVVYDSIHHDDDTDPNDYMTIAAGEVEVVATVTDNDDDEKVETIDIGPSLRFYDDAPSIDDLVAGSAVTVDEGDSDGDENGGIDPFAAVTGGLTPLGVNSGQIVVAPTGDVGEDEEGAPGITLSLTIVAGDATGSGLYTTGGTDEVILHQDSDKRIIGMVGATIIFVMEIDDLGSLTLAQYESLDHLDPLDDNDLLTFAAGVIEVHAVIEDGDGDTDEDDIDVSTLIGFYDDAPSINPDDGYIVNYTAGASTDDPVPTGTLLGQKSLNQDFGEDEEGGTVVFTGNYTDLSYTSEVKSDTMIQYFNELDDDGLFNDLLYSIVLNGNGTYTFTVHQDAPLIVNELLFESVSPGGPKEEEQILSTEGTEAIFNGFLITNLFDFVNGDVQAAYAAGNDIPAGTSLDDVNISTKGIGLKDNQMDPFEALRINFEEPGGGSSQDVEGFIIVFDGGTGANSSFDIRFVAFDDGSVEVDFTDSYTLPKGSNELVFDTRDYSEFDGATFDELFILMEFENPNNGVRIKSISLLETEEIPDEELTFEVKITDGDDDMDLGLITVGVDGNMDGSIDLV